MAVRTKRGGNTGVLCLPVGKNEALEAKLVLEEVVLDVRVLACVGIVDLLSNQQSVAELFGCADHLPGCTST